MIRDPQSSTFDLEVLLFDVSDTQGQLRGRIDCPGVLVAGQKLTSQLVLSPDDLLASKMHFLIELTPAFCRLTNHSEHGTLVNGMLVTKQSDLRHGDLVRAGRSVFLVEMRCGGAPVALAPSPTVIFAPVGETNNPTLLPAPSLVKPSPPVQVPGYQFLHSLGVGGMGTVWQAIDSRGQFVALKVIRPELALDPDSCARFRREANHLRDLRHRHIVGFREAGEVNGLLYLVMDYVPGQNLAELLSQQGRFEVGRAVRLTCQILEALGSAHNNGVVHRDVKPSNVLVHAGPEGEEIRLADFGLAKPYEGDLVSLTLTQDGVRGGTLAFSAPEMVDNFRRAGPLADQYGAAATLYHLLTARHLHNASNAVEMLISIRNRDAVPLRERRAGLPVELGNVIHRALDRDPRCRYSTVHALRAALAPFAG